MKKDRYVIILSLLVIALIGVFQYVFTDRKSYAADNTTAYADFGSISQLDHEYSNSVLYLTKESKFHILKEKGVSYEDNDVFIGDIQLPKQIILNSNSSEFILLITKCAGDSDGNLMDVVIRLNNVNIWKNTGRDDSIKNVKLIFREVYGLLNSQLDVESGAIFPEIEYGMPLKLSLGATEANVDFTMVYYKTGVSSEKVDSIDDIQGTLANVTKINTLFSDLDAAVTGSSHERWKDYYTDRFLKGDEGIIPLTGINTIYYNKNKKGSITEGTTHYNVLQEIQNGIATDYHSSLGLNLNEIWYQSTAFMTTETTTSSLTFTYGGSGCGIAFYFLSPYPYDLPDPEKIVENKKSEYRPLEQYTYKILQYIPNNFFGEKLKFNEVFKDATTGESIIPEKTIYQFFSISDDFNVNQKYLDLKMTDVRVVNESNVDVTDWFEITREQEKIVATAKMETLENSQFYGHSYILEIPVVIKENASVKIITNQARIKINDQDNLTNEIKTQIYYQLKVKYIEEGTNKELASGITEKKYFGDSYETSSSREIPEGYELVSVPKNASGTVESEDVEVIYYYRKIPKVANLYKRDKNTQNHLEGASFEVYDDKGEVVAKWETNKEVDKCNLAVLSTEKGCEVLRELEPNKTYRVKEVKTPIGYATSEEITFTTDNNGNVLEGIIIENEPIRVCISVVDINKKMIRGAEVNINNESGQYASFVSTNKEVCYTYIPVGNYNLEEIKVPEIYELAKKKGIEVKDTNKVQHFEIVNELKVPITNLDLSKLIIVIAIVLGFVGVGFILIPLYRKKLSK